MHPKLLKSSERYIIVIFLEALDHVSVFVASFLFLYIFVKFWSNLCKYCLWCWWTIWHLISIITSLDPVKKLSLLCCIRRRLLSRFKITADHWYVHNLRIVRTYCMYVLYVMNDATNFKLTNRESSPFLFCLKFFAWSICLWIAAQLEV